MKEIHNILFICSGNLSRSPLAECVLRKMLADNDVADITASSAGTHNLTGMPRDEKMVAVAHQHGYNMGGNACQMTRQMLLDADLILVMDQYHIAKVQHELPHEEWGKMYLFNEYCFGKQSEIEDPICGSTAQNEQVFQNIENGCRKIVEKLTGIVSDQPNAAQPPQGWFC